MKTMGWSLSALGGGALLAVMVSAAPAGTSAQQSGPRSGRADCRCVDRSGKDIPDCTCLRTPPRGDFMASGFALPAARARLGITVSVTQDAADAAAGALVQSVLENGPADSAGIRRGDIITSVNGKSLSAKLNPSVEKSFDTNESLPVQRLLSIAHDLDPETEVPVGYLRDGKAHTAMVHTRDLSSWPALGNLPGLEGRIFQNRMHDLRDRLDSLGGPDRQWRILLPGQGGRLRILSEDTSRDRSWRCPGERDSDIEILSRSDECIGGLRLIKLNPGLASYFKTDHGVLVSDVEANSTTGLEPGDVIVRIGGREVENPDRARRILASYSREERIDFHIIRKGKAMLVTGHLGG
jgi:membrane-associated protease RseP (regulator of RpoE activity)